MVVLQLALETDGVEVHVADILQLGLLVLRRGCEQHVEGVAGAADENVLSVDAEQAVFLVVDDRS